MASLTLTDARARAVLLALGALLAASVLRLDLPVATSGQFWSDGATYHAMAWSLAEDHDLRFEARDVLRVRREFPGGPQGIFLKRTRGGLRADAAGGFPWASWGGGEANDRVFYAKALAYAMHPARSGVPVHLAMHTLEREGAEESPSARAASDPRLAELAVFDEGLLDEFLDAREALLPAAEVDIAEGWLDQPLRVFEVVGGDDPSRVELRDTGTDERVSVLGDHGLTTGECVIARPLPVGGELWLGGPVIPLTEALRPSAEALVGAADGHTWAEWIGYAQAPEGDSGPPPTPGAGHHHHHH